MVVPDRTTRALELRKGSADIAINALTPDMVITLERESDSQVLRGPGTVLQYMAFNSPRSHLERCARPAGIGVRY